MNWFVFKSVILKKIKKLKRLHLDDKIRSFSKYNFKLFLKTRSEK